MHIIPTYKHACMFIYTNISAYTHTYIQIDGRTDNQIDRLTKYTINNTIGQTDRQIHITARRTNRNTLRSPGMCGRVRTVKLIFEVGMSVLQDPRMHTTELRSSCKLT